MTLWHARNGVRPLLVSAADGGKIILYEGCYANLATKELCEYFDGAFELRHIPVAAGWSVGSKRQMDRKIEQWVEVIAAALKEVGASRVGLEARFHGRAEAMLTARGFEVCGVLVPLERARALKGPEELTAIRHAMRVVSEGTNRMREVVLKGDPTTEAELWAILWETFIRANGEYVETRLCTSGQATNPWMQETSTRAVSKGELVALDTDAVGPFGYFIDFSRTWLHGSGNGVVPTADQGRLYQAAAEMIYYNLSLLRPGLSYYDYTHQAWKIPGCYMKNRYTKMAHGNGVAGEYPLIFHPEDWDEMGYDGVFVEGMTMSVEAYVCGGHDHVR